MLAGNKSLLKLDYLFFRLYDVENNYSLGIL